MERDVTANRRESREIGPHHAAFEIAGGSVIGRDHRKSGKPCQDAFAWVCARETIAAVVADGCGSGRYSEVGAQLGARLWTEALSRRLCAGASVADPVLWRRTRQDVLAHLRIIAHGMGGELAEVVSDYLLFTLVGAAITPSLTAVFAIGDGMVAINGDVDSIGPFPGNQPPYLAYDLLDGVHCDTSTTVRALRPTSEIDSILLATDGADDLVRVAEHAVPGRAELVGGLDQFWTSGALFRNPDAVRRRLAVINRESMSPDWDRRHVARTAGILPDDTTVVAIRRDRESP